MKKVVKNVFEDVISIETITNESFVGILWSNKRKSALATLGDSEYIGINEKNDNMHHAWTGSSKYLYVKEAVENQVGTIAYVFEDRLELLTWLNKKN